jgi:hypothetical protein
LRKKGQEGLFHQTPTPPVMPKVAAFFATLILFFATITTSSASGNEGKRKHATSTAAATTEAWTATAADASKLHTAPLFGTVFGDNGLPLVGATIWQTGNMKPYRGYEQRR